MTKHEREVMRMALKALTIFREWELGQDYNSNRDTVLVRAFKAEEAIEKCLANDALEKKASGVATKENARELGLDYEPQSWEKFCDSNCVWTDHHPDCKLAEQEPVAWRAWVSKFPQGTGSDWVYVTKPIMKDRIHNQPLYTTPPQREPLTDEEIEDLYFDKFSMGELKAFARAIEAAHGIKGKA